MGREAGPGAAPGEASKHAGELPAPSPVAKADDRPRRASLGGRPAQDRELRAQGRQTLRNLLEAGLAEFDERGFQAVRVDDIVRRAQTSHGTFYLYFSNKEDLLYALVTEAGEVVASLDARLGPVGPGDEGWRELRAWMEEFSAAWRRYAPVLRAWPCSVRTLSLMTRSVQARSTGA